MVAGREASRTSQNPGFDIVLQGAEIRYRVMICAGTAIAWCLLSTCIEDHHVFHWAS